MRQKPSWRKLKVDGLTIHVFAASRVPASIRKLTKLKGISLEMAERDEREPYIKIEKREKHRK